jgi:hypothetical protein
MDSPPATAAQTSYEKQCVRWAICQPASSLNTQLPWQPILALKLQPRSCKAATLAEPSDGARASIRCRVASSCHCQWLASKCCLRPCVDGYDWPPLQHYCTAATTACTIAAQHTQQRPQAHSAQHTQHSATFQHRTQGTLNSCPSSPLLAVGNAARWRSHHYPCLHIYSHTAVLVCS